ncbi:DUF418 domain-containing protein [Sphaerisporangium sp. TRM90804]|uniref:DUF418 domain-containing protein n=1 Tax=Sphaerisporangium sp. TRM90804 TaxID=3031113 RepID=UPI00244C64E3|nr:DUF418 domain-containing protein [Sphaerisporangium sp. TRM90804]MDH2425979.1 DUF418 domain-containing protein [Sphaerisporangium sp. TRM90804]
MPDEEFPLAAEPEGPAGRHGNRPALLRDVPSGPAGRPDDGPGDRAASPAGRPRITALDVLRGFALCGILLANVQPIANAGAPLIVTGAPTGEGAWLGLLIHQRFFPIFSLLFGVGFSLLLDSAADRAPRPRLLLLRRLLVLLAVGALHHVLLWQGDILAVYAVVGLVVLLPSTWLPRWAVAALAVALVAASLITAGGQLTMVPGLFLLGSALTRYGVIGRIERSTRVPAALGLLFAAAAVPMVAAQVGDPGNVPVFHLAGLLIAGVYVCALLVLLRTPLRRALLAVFAPLGRMALTNYLTASVIVLAVSRFVSGPPHLWPTATVFLIAAAVLTAQWLFSTLWLRRHRQGPLEWLWRWATWARRPPLRRTG